MANICFLLGGFQGSGGIGRVTSVLANELAEKEEYNITAVSYCHTDKPMLYELSDRICHERLFTSNISMAKAILMHRAVNRLAEIINRHNIDILIACGALFYPLGILAAKKTGAKCFCWEHTNPATTSDYRFQGLCRQYAKRKADKVVVLTKSAQKYYLDTLGIDHDKIVQIYNPVADDAACSEKYNVSSSGIISVGRLSYPKNFSLLIDLAAELLVQYPEWTWDIYGEGEERGALTRKIEEKGLTGRVVLKGQVRDLYKRYGNYAFQVMTSRYEGFPMSLIEGSVNRLPLVSFDIATGPAEIIEDGVNGFLIEEGRADIMSCRIKELIEDPAMRERMSENAVELVKRFEKKSIIQKWCELFKN